MLGHLSETVAHAVWADIFAWGGGIGLAILFFLAAFFSPVAKKDFFYGGVICLLAVAIYGYGTRVATAICVAKENAVVVKVDKIVAKTKTPAYRRAADPYNKRSN